MRRGWLLLAAAAVVAGCASVLGIPQGTPSFCAQSANQGHAYCEDFDVGDPSTRWTFAEANNGAAYAVQPGGLSPPNLLDMSAPGEGDGGAALAGFTKEFDDSTFVGLHIEADMRIVTPDDGPITASGGFLLIVDKNGGGCIGIGVAPKGADGKPSFGAFVFAQGAGCSALTSNGTNPSTVAGGKNYPLGDAPAPNTWVHIVVVATPNTKLADGSGTLTFNIEGQPDAFMPVPLLLGTLAPAGIPLVGFASEVTGPSGAFEVQYDNITIDLSPN
ncbi:MAG: hypothetical protein ABSE49_11925 [Polyangiaceae bacterium]|jgi:hypothetical protein